MTEEPRQHEGRKTAEWRAVREVIAREHALWGWGSDEGLLPWVDRWDKPMLVFWKSQEDAEAENAGDEEAGPGERPLRYSTEQIRERVSAWMEGGIEHIGLQPQQGRILHTLKADEFVSFLNQLEGHRPEA